MREAWPPRNHLGKQQLHRFSLMTWLRSLPNFLEQFPGRVPEEAWVADVDEDETPVAIISCSCGAEPPTRVRVNSTVECECGRMYGHFGGEIRFCPAPEPEPVPA